MERKLPELPQGEITKADASRRLAAVAAFALRDFTNLELAAFNNTIQIYGTVPPMNLAHKKAVATKLIQPNGRTWDLESIRRASVYEVNRRVTAGTF